MIGIHICTNRRFHTGLEDGTLLAVQVLATHLYWSLLLTLPQFVRGWHTSCNDRRLVLAVDAFTERYLSQLIIERELVEVQSLGSEELGSAMTAKVIRGSGGSEVRSCYR